MKEKMKTFVALVRVPERVARGWQYGSGSMAEWVARGFGGLWEADFDDPTEDGWAEDVQRLFGCRAEDREAMVGIDAGFVEPGSEAEKTIARLLEDRAEPDRERGAAVAAGLAEVAV